MLNQQTEGCDEVGDESSNELEEAAMCAALELPRKLRMQGFLTAIEENERNAPIQEPGDPGHSPMALEAERLWRPGRTLRVGFLDGDPAVHAKVVEYAKQWQEHANLTLEFVGMITGGADAEIRISFAKPGNSSYIGTNNLNISRSKATMNLGSLKPDSKEIAFSRYVLHEFGHALGAIHEHQSPDGGIPWDKPKVYAYYKETQDWDQEETDFNVLRQHDSDATNYTSFDIESIMLYPVLQDLTVGDFAVGWNKVLSETDKQFIATAYPLMVPPVEELESGVPFSGSIGQPLEEDHYHFVTTYPTTVALETMGDTDLVMALSGPNDRTTLIASDDDSGQAKNAKIERDLSPADYHVRIRHFSEKGGGAYKLLLTVPPRPSYYDRWIAAFKRIFGKG